MTSQESPALVLRDQLTELATSTHDTLTDAGCDCAYVVNVSWQRASYQSPTVVVLHAPECYMNALPPGGYEDASPAVETEPPATVKRTRKRATKSEPLSTKDEGEQRKSD